MTHSELAHQIANETVALLNDEPWQKVREFLEKRVEAALEEAFENGYGCGGNAASQCCGSHHE